MKNPFIVLGALAGMSVAAAISAYADNANVENAITSRPDLSNFYNVLVSTGVNRELRPDTSYTVFAPTNNVLARMHHDPACFSMPACQAQMAEIVRNHIVPGKIHIDNAVQYKGGLFSLDGRFVNIGEPSKDDFTADGNNILSMSSFHGGMLYKIDGVIANPREMAALQNAEFAAASPTQVTTVTRHTIPDPACGPAGCTDRLTQTTTVTHVLAEPYTEDMATPVPVPLR